MPQIDCGPTRPCDLLYIRYRRYLILQFHRPTCCVRSLPHFFIININSYPFTLIVNHHEPSEFNKRLTSIQSSPYRTWLVLVDALMIQHAFIYLFYTSYLSISSIPIGSFSTTRHPCYYIARFDAPSCSDLTRVILPATYIISMLASSVHALTVITPVTP
ncbi:hypothetical protein BDZ94DRAFT_46537 [Collybia nuda]|uniref:Uncharacterized protein n=1 Tax=Collybia nuda TaxID=64659 RepID=A0A9P5YJB0_9AGAR|nr:hypothetical protein BDZ94DRAFT_46537 [Collybia nuda]